MGRGFASFDDRGWKDRQSRRYFYAIPNLRSLQIAARLAVYLVLLLTTGTRTRQGSNGLGLPVVRAGEG